MAGPSHNPNSLAAPPAFRRFFLGITCSFAGLIALCALLNTWVNPQWITHAPWTSEKFAENRMMRTTWSRTGKAGLARTGTWDTILLGSSRVAIALDPNLPAWHDPNVVNLALSGGSLIESAAVARYAINHQPGLKRAVLGVDLTDLTSENDMSRAAGFYESPLNEKGEVFERNLRYVVGMSSVHASVLSLQFYYLKHQPGPYTAKGHWARYRSHAEDSPRKVIARDSIPYALRYVRERKVSIQLSQRKVDALRQCLGDCLSHNIKLLVLIPPNHSAYLSVFPIEGDPDPFFAIDRKAIVREVDAANRARPAAPPAEVWDFNDFHPLNSVAMPPPERAGDRLPTWADGTHAFEPVGNVMLARMMGWPLSDPIEESYGEKIDSANIDAHLDHIRRTYDNYKREHAVDWQWVKGLVGGFSSTGPENEPEAPN